MDEKAAIPKRPSIKLPVKLAAILSHCFREEHNTKCWPTLRLHSSSCCEQMERIRTTPPSLFLFPFCDVLSPILMFSQQYPLSFFVVPFFSAISGSVCVLIR